MPLIDLYRALDTERRKVIVGQRWTFDQLLVALLTDGHVLLEGVPGVAKTLMARTLATTCAPTSSASSSRPTSCPPT